MSEIRDKVEKEIADILYKREYNKPYDYPNLETGLSRFERTVLYREIIDKVFSIPELAIVDREAEIGRANV